MVRRIEGSQMTTEPYPCVECIGLVGADSHREPHSELSPVSNGSVSSSFFKCGTCKVDWAHSSLGWSRLATA
jgi:hypothetical protein